MKLVDANIVGKAEAQFFDKMSSEMDLGIIGKLFRKNKNLQLSGEAEFQALDVLVHNNQIAFKFDYTVNAYFSIFIDRSGSFVGMEETADRTKHAGNEANFEDSLVNANIIKQGETRLAEAIADAISMDYLKRLIQVKTRAKLHDRIDFMGARFAVQKDQVVYNLIYQGEIALSFLVDQKGRFLDFADADEISGEAEKKPESPTAKAPVEIDDHIIADGPEEFETHELIDETVTELIDDEELQGLEDLIIGEMEDSDHESASS